MLQRYAIALALYVLALLLRVAILPPNGSFVFVSFYPGMVVAFFLCGLRPGQLYALASTLTIFVLVPAPAPGLPGMLAKLAALGIFLGSAWIIGLLVSRVQQVTVRWREIAEALAASERRYAGILQDQTDLICRTNAAGQMLYVNEAFCRFFGGPAEGYLGRPWTLPAEAEDAGRVGQRLALLGPGQPVVSLEVRVRDAGGQLAWMHFIYRAIFDSQQRLVEVQCVGRDVTVRRDLEERLSFTAREMTDLYDNAPCGYHSLAPDGSFLNVNQRELDWLGLQREEVVCCRRFSDFLTPEGAEAYRERLARLLATGRVEDQEFDLVGAQGIQRRVSISSNAVRDPGGKVIATRAVLHDISELHAARSELTRLGAEQYRMLDNELVGIVKLRRQRITWANRGAHRIFARTDGALRGRSVRLLFPGREQLRRELERSATTLARGGIYREQVQMVTGEGRMLWIDAIGVTLAAAERETLWILADVTEMKAYQDRVEHIAYHDALTGLPNRLLLRDRLDRALATAARTGRQMAVCYLDLDGFKPINDRHGHETGDRILAEVALRLTACLRANDTVARVGGDEFVVILDDVEGEAGGNIAIDRLLEAIVRPFHIDGSPPFAVSASVGVALLPRDAASADALLRLADAAMYEAKRLGKNRICWAGQPLVTSASKYG